MQYNPKIHNRKSMRFNGYDYSQEGAYFITICCKDRACLFGEIKNREMILNANGIIAHNEWLQTTKIRSNVELDVFVIMPNHIHGIVIINNHAIDDRRGVLHTPGLLMNDRGNKPDVLHAPGLLMNDRGNKPDVLHTPGSGSGTSGSVLGTSGSVLGAPGSALGASGSIKGVCDTPLQKTVGRGLGVCNTSLQKMDGRDMGVCNTSLQITVGRDMGVCNTSLQKTVVRDMGLCNTPLQKMDGRDLGVCNTPLRSPSNTIGAIVRGYKSAVTKQINILGSGNYNQSSTVWQRNYHDHIIRNEQSYQHISNYIINNPAKWDVDTFHKI